MRQICLWALFSVVLVPQAQIQVTQSDMPALNDTIRYSQAIPGVFDFKQTGTGYSWDFTSMQPASQDIYSFKSLLSAYPSLTLSGMPAGAIGYKISDSLGLGAVTLRKVYSFYEKKSSAWLGVGTAFTIDLGTSPVPAGAVYSDKDELYTFPLKYGDKDSTTFKVTTPLGLSQFLNFGSFIQQGYRLNVVEGWGTISTPYASSVKCIKLKSTIVEHDSMSLAIPSQPPVNQGFPLVRVEYKWLSNTEKIPVLEVSGTEVAGVFTPNFIRYRDQYRKIVYPVSPVIKFSVNKASGYEGKDTFFFSNQSTPLLGNTYLWQINPSLGVRFVNGTTNASRNPSLMFDSSGLYSITLSAENMAGQSDSTATDMIRIAKKNQTHVSTFITGTLVFYPNPVREFLYFASDIPDSRYTISDLAGRLILSGTTGGRDYIDCSKITPGCYVLEISGNTTHLHTQIIKD